MGWLIVSKDLTMLLECIVEIMEIKQIERGSLISVRYKHNNDILFTAFFKNGVERRKDIADLIKSHLEKYDKNVTVQFSEERYTPFIVHYQNVEVRECIYSLETHYSVC